jgi:hypothetical protein
MKGPRRQWWGGLAGIVTVLSLAAASVLVRHSPSTDQPTGDVTGYFTNHRPSALLAAYLLGFGATVLLFFVGALRELLGRDEDRHGLADVALAAGVTLVAVVVVGAATLAVLAFRPDTTPAAARALYDANGLLIAFASFPAAAFLSSASVVVLRSRVLPSWLGWAGLLVAAAELVGAASFGQQGLFRPQGDLVAVQAGANGLLLWLLATSLLMLGRASPVTYRRGPTRFVG